MSRMTLRLPETLHQQLMNAANSEGVSLNQYIVFALTRQVTLAYTVQPVPDRQIQEQRAAYTALLQSLGSATHEEIRAILDERENAGTERELSPEVVSRLQERLHEGV
jgi:predicted HicB family RNase H-like nuclease